MRVILPFCFHCLFCTLSLVATSQQDEAGKQAASAVAEPGKYRELLPKYKHTPASESKGKESDDKGMMGKGETRTGGTSSQGSTTIAFFKNSYSTTLL
jgi:hypothetical protein